MPLPQGNKNLIYKFFFRLPIYTCQHYINQIPKHIKLELSFDLGISRLMIFQYLHDAEQTIFSPFFAQDISYRYLQRCVVSSKGTSMVLSFLISHCTLLMEFDRLKHLDFNSFNFNPMLKM